MPTGIALYSDGLITQPAVWAECGDDLRSAQGYDDRESFEVPSI